MAFFKRDNKPVSQSHRNDQEKPFFEPSKSTSSNEIESEREADSIADQVVNKPNSGFFSDNYFFPPKANQAPAIQRKAETSANAASTQSTGQNNVGLQLNEGGGGEKMDDNTRGQMENAFGHDFSNVNIHRDSKAAQMNDQLGAQAFTHGNDIYFNEGKYSPESNEGRHLLAHELTHTIQQGGSKKSIAMKRDPNAEDQAQLTKFEVYLAMLDAQREQTMQSIAERTEQMIPQLEESLARTDITSDDRLMLQSYKQNRIDTWTAELKAVDDAILAVKYEKLTYLKALERAHSSDKIVWHSSSIGAGWVSERESYMLHSMANDPFYQLGRRHGMFFAKLRSEGVSLETAIAKVMILAAGDLTGVSGVVEAIKGRDIVTDQKLSLEERLKRGIVGIIGLASLTAAAGPRVASWAKTVGGTQFRLVQTSAGTLTPVLVMGEAGAVLALTQAEIFTLASAGLLNVSSMQMSAYGGGKPVSGLNNASRGKPRGGGGSADDQAYTKKVNKENGSKPEGESVYVDGVEFDGYNPGTKKLLDSKRSKGKGSWYDVSGSDSFTQNVKIPDILKQARRQLSVLGKSGADGIIWHVSDAGIAKQLSALFKTNGINIMVKFTAP